MASPAERVLQRVAKEFTPGEWEDYLKEHPKADRSKHTIKKDKAKPPPVPDAAKKKGPPPIPEAAKKKKPITPPVPESARKKSEPPPAPEKPEPPKAEKPEHDEHKQDDHEPEGAKPGRLEAWRDRLKGLSEGATTFMKTAPKAVKTFLGDPEFRKNTLKEAGKHLTAKAIKDRVVQTVKDEVKEYKTAIKGVKKVLTGGKMNKHEKHAFRTVAIHLSIGAAAAAFMATGPLSGAAIFAKGIARQIALKSVKKSLENVHLMDEASHVGHGVSHFFSHLASEEDSNLDNVMADFVLACVLKELENLSDEDLVQALNGMGEGEQEAPEAEQEPKTASGTMDDRTRRVLSRFIEAGYSGWDPPEGADEPDPSEEWNEVTKLFPKPLQKLLGDPRPKSDHGFGDVTVTMTQMVELGEDSGVELTVTASVSEDADEDGRYMHRSTDTEYYFWVGHKHWGGDNRRGSHLKQHLKEFAKVLEEQDPEGYKKAGF